MSAAAAPDCESLPTTTNCAIKVIRRALALAARNVSSRCAKGNLLTRAEEDDPGAFVQPTYLVRVVFGVVLHRRELGGGSDGSAVTSGGGLDRICYWKVLNFTPARNLTAERIELPKPFTSFDGWASVIPAQSHMSHLAVIYGVVTSAMAEIDDLQRYHRANSAVIDQLPETDDFPPNSKPMFAITEGQLVSWQTRAIHFGWTTKNLTVLGEPDKPLARLVLPRDLSGFSRVLVR